MKIRNKCIFCYSSDIVEILDKDLKIPQCYYILDIISNVTDTFIPYNIQQCKKCKIYQNKYLTDLNILYQNSHINPIGSIRKNMLDKFSNLILQNKDINVYIEIEGGTGELSDVILNNQINNLIDKKYYIIDPCYTGTKKNKIIINKFIGDINHNDIFLPKNGEKISLIMSHVFEHFYEPNNILNYIFNIPNLSNISDIYICHPDFNSYLIQNTHNFLHVEHTFFIDNEFLIKLFKKYGYELITDIINIDNYAVLFHFKKYNINLTNILINETLINNLYIDNYINKLKYNITYLNNIIFESINKNKKIYIWPCSFHSFTLFNFGLLYDKLHGILDNSTSKINKYVYGYNIKCYDYNSIINSIIIISGGCFNKELSNSNNEFIYYLN